MSASRIKMARLTEKRALVTGGRQGIGRAIVEAFIREGAQVLTCGRGQRPSDLAEAVGWQQVDITSSADITALALTVEERFGGLDVLVNNAGVQVEKTVAESTDEDWDLVMNTNAKGVFMACRAFLPKLSAGLGGSIINIGSISGHVSDPSMALYNASKAFVHGLTRSIAVDHGPAVRCNAICPGWIMTGMAEAGFDLAKDPAAAQKDALARHPVGRFGMPEDIAAMAVWLASDEALYASGQMFTIDGGMTAASPLNPGLF